MDDSKVVVLGAGYGGLMTALRLARRARRAQVTLIDASDTFVERIRLHQVSAGQPFPRRPLASFLDGTGVRFVHARVTGIDLGRRAITLADAPEIFYDRLVYALGGAADTARAPGAAEHCYTLSPDSVAALRAAIPSVAARGGRLIVIGGGLTGIEAAAELAESFPSLRVALLAAGEIGAGLSPRARRHLLRALARLGVEALEGTAVSRVGAVELSAGEIERPFDLCLWAGGVRALPLARAAGLAVDDRGLIQVDACLRSRSHPEVYAVGDAALPESAPHDMSCQAAMPMGAHAADNLAAALAGKSERPFYFGLTLRCISLGRKDAVVQKLTPAGAARGFVVTGRFGAFIKERLCRYTIYMLRLTRRWAGVYHWRRIAPPSLPAASDQARLAA